MHNGPRGRSYEKSNNFGGAIKRLIKELNVYIIFIILCIIFSLAASILEILAPDKLSNLTDQITKGLVVNTKNITTITTKVTNNFENIDYQKLMTSSKLSVEDKNELMTFFTFIQTSDISDKKVIIDKMNNLSDNIQNNLLPSITVDKIKITSKDQLKYMKEISSLKEDSDPEEIYKKIDKIPKSIRKAVEPNMNLNKIRNIAILILILYAISSILNFIQAYILADISNKFARNLRDRISKKINRLPLSYFDNNQIGDVLSRVTNDVDTVGMSLNQALSNLVKSITLLAGSTFMMFKTDSIMALTAILSSIIGFIFMGIILSKSQKYFNARQKELGKLNSHIEEIYSGLLVVKAYNAKKISDKKFDDCNEKVREANQKSQFLSGMMMPLMNFIGNFGYVCVCVVGALLVMNNKITFGVIVAFIVYVRLFSQPLTSIAQSLTNLQSSGAASERVFEFLDEKEMEEEKNKKKLLVKDAKGNIEFKDVSFSYDGEKTIIKKFSAKVKPGQKIAIVGPTGAGKTTMVNLLMKFYNISKGDIIIDGVSIKDITRENVHKLFTMVLQDTWLFDGTIRDNIKFNRKNITDKQIWDALKTVGISHFVSTLPGGLDARISDNDSISSGQKQLLTIARGMIEDSPFLILDEATSNVDTRTEELVQKAMDKLAKGRTSFIIAHRLSTIKNADVILVMKDGDIVEQGNHDELMKLNGFYAELYNSQFEL